MTTLKRKNTTLKLFGYQQIYVRYSGKSADPLKILHKNTKSSMFSCSLIGKIYFFTTRIICMCTPKRSFESKVRLMSLTKLTLVNR